MERRTITYQSAERNTAILRRLESDVATLTKEIKDLKQNLEFITQYIKSKQERDNAKWFY